VEKLTVGKRRRTVWRESAHRVEGGVNPMETPKGAFRKK